MNNDILKVRAEERMGQAINATQPLTTLILDIVAFRSNNEKLKKVATVITVIEAIDKVRIIILSLRARNEVLENIDDEDVREEVRKDTSVFGLLSRSINWKYQLTGRSK